MIPPASAPGRDPAASLWAVTSYYNPGGYRRRQLNYRVFRDQLELPLLTIEWSPSGRFELGPGDADLLVQVGGGDPMWQKERLLNLAIARLPAACRHVAWLDCDIVFEREGWSRRALARLDDTPLVQLFGRVAYLRPVSEARMVQPGAWRAAQAEREVAGVALAHRERPGWWRDHDPARPHPGWMWAHRPQPGFAWAARRDLLERHPLLDFWVVGGGDAAYVYAALGDPEHVVGRHRLTAAHRAHYLAHAEALAGTLGGRIGHLDERILHLWHGELDDRQYMARHEILRAHAYDPARHLQAHGSGVWAWRDAPHAMREALVDYFRSRREDGAPEPARGA